MSKPESESGDIFHLDNFRTLVELMAEHDLSEVEMRRGNERLRLRRGAMVPTMSVQAPTYAPPPASAPAAAASAPSAPAAAAPASEEGTIIRSPMVGTFYLSAKPGQPPFVKVGDQVGPETTICIIEAMKVFNEIPAETSGKILAVLAENGAAVEYNQPLFRLDPRG
jgi:acetyl-CoA carboxylase biotin carboxyl carrier protein